MQLTDIKLASEKLVPAKTEEIEKFENQRWIKFPLGYEQYLTQFGQGLLFDQLVRIYPPKLIQKELEQWRNRIEKYWFWDKGKKTLPKERALECIIIGDTTQGDEIIFHPSKPDHIFILPNESDQIFDAGKDLMSALNWICTSKKICPPISDYSFTPKKITAQKQTANDSSGQSLDDLVKLIKAWKKRHNITKISNEDLKEHIEDSGQEIKTIDKELIYEGLCIAGDYDHKENYVMCWKLIDNTTQKHKETVTWNYSDDSQGLSSIPADK